MPAASPVDMSALKLLTGASQGTPSTAQMPESCAASFFVLQALAQPLQTQQRRLAEFLRCRLRPWHAHFRIKLRGADRLRQSIVDAEREDRNDPRLSSVETRVEFLAILRNACLPPGCGVRGQGRSRCTAFRAGHPPHLREIISGGLLVFLTAAKACLVSLLCTVAKRLQ